MSGRKDAYRDVYAALDATGLPWKQVTGKKHEKLYLDGHLVGVLPQGRAKTDFGSVRRAANVISQIRKAAESLIAARAAQKTG